MIKTTWLLSLFVILSSTGCGRVAVSFEESEPQENRDDGMDNSQKCPALAKVFCVETAEGIYETKSGTSQKDKCEVIEPEGKIVDFDLCNENVSCTEDAMSVCLEITPGVYFSTGIGRTGPDCKFPTEGIVKHELCKATIHIEELASWAQLHDGKEVAISGTFKDFRNEPVPDCASPTPFVGTPTLSSSYQQVEGGIGVMTDTTAIKASFAVGDTRSPNLDFIKKIYPDSRITMRGVFRYKTVVPVCSNGAIVHPSGTVELQTEKQKID